MKIGEDTKDHDRCVFRGESVKRGNEIQWKKQPHLSNKTASGNRGPSRISAHCCLWGHKMRDLGWTPPEKLWGTVRAYYHNPPCPSFSLAGSKKMCGQRQTSMAQANFRGRPPPAYLYFPSPPPVAPPPPMPSERLPLPSRFCGAVGLNGGADAAACSASRPTALRLYTSCDARW